MQAYNAFWCTKDGLKFKVWADGGCIWGSKPSGPEAEFATYETDENGVHYIVLGSLTPETVEFMKGST